MDLFGRPVLLAGLFAVAVSCADCCDLQIRASRLLYAGFLSLPAYLFVEVYILLYDFLLILEKGFSMYKTKNKQLGSYFYKDIIICENKPFL